MTKKQNDVWSFFASMKLALWIIPILAVTSIIGTVIPQGHQLDYYIQSYGPELARLFYVLDFTSMYDSWWYITLLIIFSVNLTVCSIDRVPTVWRMVRLDNLNTTPERLQKMPLKAEVEVDAPLPAASVKVGKLLAAAGWRSASRAREDGSIMFFSQKGAWSRLGPYVIHSGIPIIMLGAIVGNVFGFKASIFFPEGETVSHVFERGTRLPIPLGFSMQASNFEITRHPNGMVREYTTDLRIVDPLLSEPLYFSLMVNYPLKHRGMTFYQASYEPMDEFMISVRNKETGRTRHALVPSGRQVNWPEENVLFEITNTLTDHAGRAHKLEILFSEPGAIPSVFVMQDEQSVAVQRPENTYVFFVRQRYATGIQVAKDPGVWIVYAGFALMTLGLYVVFMVTHRRIWAHLRQDAQGRTWLMLCGGSNRNKETFDQRFTKLTDYLRQNQIIKSGAKPDAKPGVKPGTKR
ncbi:MAG: cytochrome c biogenesis protein ResB [Desulfobulbaceae bacterium]|nr:MAG: cytochrome c biogenesis protein ResB [Desulfobulbaceae bacterium]